MRQPGSIVLIRPRGFHYHVFFVSPTPPHGIRACVVVTFFCTLMQL